MRRQCTESFIKAWRYLTVTDAFPRPDCSGCARVCAVSILKALTMTGDVSKQVLRDLVEDDEEERQQVWGRESLKPIPRRCAGRDTSSALMMVVLADSATLHRPAAARRRPTQVATGRLAVLAARLTGYATLHMLAAACKRPTHAATTWS
jgi:hypothetical protein